MTPTELEAYDAMMADRDLWRARFKALERVVDTDGTKDLAILRDAIVSALYDCSSLRHGMYSPPQFNNRTREIVGRVLGVETDSRRVGASNP